LTTLDNLRKAAKRWLKALQDGDADARTRLETAAATLSRALNGA
jgi:hypothetical protein